MFIERQIQAGHHLIYGADSLHLFRASVMGARAEVLLSGRSYYPLCALKGHLIPIAFPFPYQSPLPILDVLVHVEHSPIYVEPARTPVYVRRTRPVLSAEDGRLQLPFEEAGLGRVDVVDRAAVRVKELAVEEIQAGEGEHLLHDKTRAFGMFAYQWYMRALYEHLLHFTHRQ